MTLTGPVPITSAQSLRLRIMQNLATRFTSIRKGVDGYTVEWNTVRLRPLTQDEMRFGALAIFAPKEKKERQTGFDNCFITLQIEFFLPLAMGDEPSDIINMGLLDVQRAIASDLTCGGLALNIVETGNEVDVDGPFPSIVAGVVQHELMYRHRAGNPTLQR